MVADDQGRQRQGGVVGPRHRPAIQTLERLHSELGGQILENKEEAQRLAGQMLHVEAVIKMLAGTFLKKKAQEIGGDLR